jgi:DNA polymerase-3 subunit epsilon
VAFNAEFNGQRITREMMTALAEEKGMSVKNNVTKSLDMLVCADPDSMSSKAKKAREYGIRIMAEPTFMATLGSA